MRAGYYFPGLSIAPSRIVEQRSIINVLVFPGLDETLEKRQKYILLTSENTKY